MLQSRKAKEPSTFTLVPHTQPGSTAANPPVSFQSEGRAPLPQPVVVSSPKISTTGRSGLNRKLVLMGAAAAVLLAGSWLGYDYLTVGRFVVTTDDAYVRAYNTTLGAKVAGYVSEFLVEDNTKVRAGDVIARIDDGDYRLAADAARDKIATQQATIERFDRQIDAQRANIEQMRAQLFSAQAGQKRMQSELERQQALAGKEFATKQTLEQSTANRDQADASVRSAQAGLDSAIANLDVLQAQKKEAARSLDELKTALAKAQRDLSFAEIRAPVDGVVANRAAQVGDFVQTGQRIAALVPLSNVFIDANFKETQLARVRPGQPVSISVDALPDEKFSGVVTSVSPASGAVFSLLPPDNATGNFTKIVQRLAVRIQVPPDVAERAALRPGMSVIAAVNTRPAAAPSPAAQTPAGQMRTAAN
jgi:membrane fusion protein, multidrug efflux system